MRDQVFPATALKGGSLEPTVEEMKVLMDVISRFVVSVTEGLPGSLASDYDGAEELALSLSEEDPSVQGLEELLDTLTRASSKGMNHLHPGYLAFIPISGVPIGAIADLLAGILNRYVTLWWPSPAMAQLEWNALRWISNLFGYPETSRGTFTSGGSLANFSALVAARQAKLGSNHAQGRLYMTDQTHHSNQRAARLAGFSPESVVIVPTDADLKMDVPTLRRQIESDRAAGERPFMVLANAGTTNTGAVDPILDIATVCSEQDVWLHVDAAYGGFFILTQQGRTVLRGIELADSITVDPHKGMFLPMGTGCVLVREGSHLRDAHLGEGAYLSDLQREQRIPNFADYSIELTRSFRGLRIWMALKLFGWEPFTQALNLNLHLARRLHDALAEDGRWELPWEPRLSTVAFRLKGSTASTQQSLLDSINRSGEVFMSSTTIDRPGTTGGTWLRACFLSHRSDASTAERAIDAILKGAETSGVANRETR